MTPYGLWLGPLGVALDVFFVWLNTGKLPW